MQEIETLREEKFKEVLTDEQLNKFKEDREQRRREFQGGRQGGQGGGQRQGGGGQGGQGGGQRQGGQRQGGGGQGGQRPN